MDDKIIFKPEKGTASYNPLIDNIELEEIKSDIEETKNG